MNRWTRWISRGICANAIILAGVSASPAHASFSVAVDLYVQDRPSYSDDVWVDFVPQEEAWVALYAVYSDGSIVPVWPTWNQRPYWQRCYGPQSIRVDVPRGLCLQSVEAYASYDWFDPWGYYEACRPVYIGSPWRHPCEVAVVHAYPVSAWSFSFQWYSGWNDRCDRPVHGCSARKICAVPGYDYSGWKRKSHDGRRDYYRSRMNEYREVVRRDVVREDRRFDHNYDRAWDQDDNHRIDQGNDRVWDREDREDDGAWARNDRRRDREEIVLADQEVSRPVERSHDSQRVRDASWRGDSRERVTSHNEQRADREERIGRAEPQRQRVESRQRVEPRRERAESRRERVEPRREHVDRGSDSREQGRVDNASSHRSSKRESLEKSEKHRRDSTTQGKKSSEGGKQGRSDKKSSKDRRVSGEPKGRSRS